MTGSIRGRNQGARWVPVLLLVTAVSILLASRARAADEAIEVEAPAALVWSVLTDFESWPGFMPSLRSVHVAVAPGDRVAIRHESETLGFAVAFTMLTRVDDAHMRLEGSLDPSAANDLRAMESTWQLTELADGGTRVECHSDLESGQPVPRFLERRVHGESVAESVAALAAEVERRQGQPLVVSAVGP